MLWRRLIHTATRSGQAEAALQEIQRLAEIHRNKECKYPNPPTNPAALIRECGNSGDLTEARTIHASLTKSGLLQDRFLSNLLIEMYGKCGSVQNALNVFEAIHFPNVYSWTLLIAAYAQNGHTQDALFTFRKMDHMGISPDSVTFVNVFNTLTHPSMLPEGRLLHQRALLSGFDPPDVFLGTSIVNMYGKCKRVYEAELAFESMDSRDVIAWNAMLSAYAQNGHMSQALSFFREMLVNGVRPDEVVFISLLDTVDDGRAVQEIISEAGFGAEGILGNALVNMYGRCGELLNASKAFGKILLKTTFSWNVLLTAYLQNELRVDVLKLFMEMLQDGIRPDSVTFINVVDACTGLASLHESRILHDLIVESGVAVNVSLGNALVNMFRRVGSVADAKLVFDSMTHRDVVTWTAMLSSYAQLGLVPDAFDVFHNMDLEGVYPDSVTYIGILEACDGPVYLREGRKIHMRVSSSEFLHDVTVNTSLVNMYSKCGSFEDAKCVFDGMLARNKVTWNAMVRAFAAASLGYEAFGAFYEMQLEGTKPDTTTFLILLDASKDLSQGQMVHSRIVQEGVQDDVGVPHTLMIMYGRLGSTEDAKLVFERTRKQEQEPSRWNAIIVAYAQNGYLEEAARFLSFMDLTGVKPNRYTYVGLLDACSSTKHVEELHIRLSIDGFLAEKELGNALVNSYGQCRDSNSSKAVFDSMKFPSVISWTSLIVAYANNSQCLEALEMLHKMNLEGVHPNRVTLLSLIEACVNMVPVEKSIVNIITKMADGFESTVILETALLNMHGKCGSIEDAERIFDRFSFKDSIAWNAMMSAYAQNEYNLDAIRLFRTMDFEGVKPYKVTFLGLLDAVSAEGDLETAKQAHTRLVEVGLIPNAALENALINTYGRCGSVEHAKAVFENISCTDDPVQWGAMIAAYSQNWFAEDAMELFKLMDFEGLKPSKTTFLRLIESCGVLGVLSEGKNLHKRIEHAGFLDEVILGNALVIMYGKCGSLQAAREAFNAMKASNLVSWTTMVSTYTIAGHSTEALELFQAMNVLGLEPSTLTFTSIISGCSHAGMVIEGIRYFSSMVEDHYIAPDVGHYSCVVDMLGRVGWLNEAEEFIHKMPKEWECLGFKVLLGACRLHGELERGSVAACKASDHKRNDSTPYVLLANMYLEAN